MFSKFENIYVGILNHRIKEMLREQQVRNTTQTKLCGHERMMQKESSHSPDSWMPLEE